MPPLSSALKEKLSGDEYSKIPAARQRLIYSGRVLKDPDTLASYKVKEGNTIHLVKSAESNQSQNPANATGSGTSTAAAAPAVPQMAAGTGRDPLAALTGARYAGYAQMPNANMFGPDGGVSPGSHPFHVPPLVTIYAAVLTHLRQMGPPPDPENLASMLENPNFASTLNEALGNPDVVEQMIRSNPMFQGAMGAQARQLLQDPSFRRMMTDPAHLRQMNEMRRTMPGMFAGMPGMGGATGGGNEAFPMPGATDGTPAAGEGAGEREATPGQTNNAPAGGALPPTNPFAMFGQPGATGAGGQANPFAALFGPGGMGALGAGTGAGPTTPDTGTGQQQQPPANNPIATMAQQLMQNPQLMQQMMASTGTNPGGADPANAAAAQAGFNPFAALQAMQGFGGGAGGAEAAAAAGACRYKTTRGPVCGAAATVERHGFL